MSLVLLMRSPIHYLVRSSGGFEKLASEADQENGVIFVQSLIFLSIQLTPIRLYVLFPLSSKLDLVLLQLPRFQRGLILFKIFWTSCSFFLFPVKQVLKGFRRSSPAIDSRRPISSELLAKLMFALELVCFSPFETSQNGFRYCLFWCFQNWKAHGTK